MTKFIKFGMGVKDDNPVTLHRVDNIESVVLYDEDWNEPQHESGKLKILLFLKDQDWSISEYFCYEDASEFKFAQKMIRDRFAQIEEQLCR